MSDGNSAYLSTRSQTGIPVATTRTTRATMASGPAHRRPYGYGTRTREVRLRAASSLLLFLVATVRVREGVSKGYKGYAQLKHET
eukprot:scaffold239355_cov22-Prasinocladus_malaysianus.AAC.1